MAVFIESENLHGNVPGGGVLLEMVENRPAQHVGKENVERNGGGMELPRQSKSLGASRGDQHFEAFVARQVAQHAGIVRIVFDDQEHRVVRLQILAIVGNMLDGTLCGYFCR